MAVRREELSEDANSAFRDPRDRQLTRLGVPTAMLAVVRGVRDETGLDAKQSRLPVEAYEALRPPGEAPEQRKAIEVAKCRRETVERIITVAMGAPPDVTELR